MLGPLHILTACARPAGLPLIAAACAAAPPPLDVRWHVGFDLERRHVGGQAVKNRLLDAISPDAPGYVWVCDDDNAPAPGFFERLAGLPPAPLYLFGQRRPTGYAPARPPAVGHTDVAQVVVSRAVVGELRLPETYEGDGHWIVALWARCGGGVLVDEPLTTYNAQR